jgi:hypothetical protein
VCLKTVKKSSSGFTSSHSPILAVNTSLCLYPSFYYNSSSKSFCFSFSTSSSYSCYSSSVNFVLVCQWVTLRPIGFSNRVSPETWFKKQTFSVFLSRASIQTYCWLQNATFSHFLFQVILLKPILCFIEFLIAWQKWVARVIKNGGLCLKLSIVHFSFIHLAK